ncbi:DUF2975 domain-containing protein [Mucilaginibacter sp.]|uniref:DUF2975 domain-containing protein n=1 Tax=Mucilaginibacter sp. TaxID=1882438 RepID=UPI0035BBB7EA
MKKIRSLQILVYIVFGLLFIQNIAGAVYHGAIEGWNSAGTDISDTSSAYGQLLPDVVLNHQLVTNSPSETLKVGDDYTLSSINVTADVRVHKPAQNSTPFWFDLIKFAVVALECLVIIKIVRSINQFIELLAKNEMFSEQCIALIRTTGIFVLAFPVLDYVFDWLNYFEQKMLLSSKLHVVNSATFGFEILLLAIFIFIIAEAFKQGAKLKEQQDLTI